LVSTFESFPHNSFQQLSKTQPGRNAKKAFAAMYAVLQIYFTHFVKYLPEFELS